MTDGITPTPSILLFWGLRGISLLNLVSSIELRHSMHGSFEPMDPLVSEHTPSTATHSVLAEFLGAVRHVV